MTELPPEATLPIHRNVDLCPIIVIGFSPFCRKTTLLPPRRISAIR